MSWQSAQKAAEQLLPAIADRPVVFLPDFATEDDLLYFEPDCQWTLTFQRMVNTALSRMLARQDKETRYVEIKRGDYVRWLLAREKKDCKTRRAEFVALKLRPSRKE